MMCTGVIHLKGKLPRIWASPQIKNSMRCPTLISLYVALLPLPICVYKRTMMGFYHIKGLEGPSYTPPMFKGLL